MSLRSAWTTGKDDPFLQRTWNESIWKCVTGALLIVPSTQTRSALHSSRMPHSRSRIMTLISSLLNMLLQASVCVTTAFSARPGCCPLIQIIRASLKSALFRLQSTSQCRRSRRPFCPHVLVSNVLDFFQNPSDVVDILYRLAWVGRLCFSFTRTTLPASVLCDRD